MARTLDSSKNRCLSGLTVRWAGGSFTATTGRLVGPEGTHVLREKEVRLLALLVHHAGRVVSRAVLLREVFGYAESTRTHTVRTTVNRTRKAVDSVGLDGGVVQTVYGEGYRWNGPPAQTDLHDAVIGRDHETLVLLDALRADRLVTLVGPGGVGKTTLARRIQTLRDGVFVDLVGCTTRGDMERATLAAMGQEWGTDCSFALLRHGVGLLVLDNLEQLTGVAREIITAWLHAVPTLRVLGTSRCAVDIVGERVVSLEGLRFDAARALFGRHCRRDTLDHDALTSVLELLEGHPLSITLAAARSVILPLEELRSRLADSHAVLASHSDAGGRHRSAHAVVESSLTLLPEPLVVALARLSVLDEPASFAQVRVVLDLQGVPAADVLEDLVGHHLVARLPGPRFRVQEAVRSCLRDRATPTDLEEMAAARERFVDHTLHAVGSSERVDAKVLVVAIRMAIVRGRRRDAAWLLHVSLDRHRRGQDPQILRPLVDAIGPGDDPVSIARTALVRVALDRHRDPDADPSPADEAVLLARRSRDETVLCSTLEHRAEWLANHGEIERFEADLDEALALHRAAGRRWRVARIGLLRASAALRSGDMELLDARLGEVTVDLLELPFADRFWFGQLRCAVSLGASRWPQAGEAAERLVRLAEEGSAEHRAWALVERAYVLGVQGDLVGAREVTEEALALASQAWLVTRLMCNRFGMLAYERRWAEAQEQQREAVRLTRRQGGRARRLALLRSGWLARVRGDLDDAVAFHAQSDGRRVAHLEEVLQEPLLHAQSGDLDRALEEQRAMVAQLSPGRRAEFLRASLLLAELELAAGHADRAWDALSGHVGRVDLEPYEQPRFRVLSAAVAGQRPPEFRAPDPLTALDLTCWSAFALAKSGDPEGAREQFAVVRTALGEDGLASTSELGWRLGVSRRAAGFT